MGHENTMIMIMFNLDWADSLLASSLSLDVVPRLCRLRTVRYWPLDQDFCQYWPHTLVSLIPQLFHYEKGQPCTRSGEIVRVAYTHPVNPHGRTMQGGGVLCYQVALDPFMFWRIRVKVDICRFRTCICRVVRKP
jgi:hypothetical protein